MQSKNPLGLFEKKFKQQKDLDGKLAILKKLK